MPNRKPYPSDVYDEEWAFVAPYLALVREDAPQRIHDLLEVLNGLRWVVRTGSPWRYMPHDLPPWEAVYQQTRRWLSAGVFEAMVHDLRVLLRLSEGRASKPTAAILDSRTLQSTPESGTRGGYDGAKRKKGSKVHAAVDTLGHLLALHVTPANEQERARVGELAEAVQEATGESVGLAYTWTRAMPGNVRRKKRRLMASVWRWSSTWRPNAASCYYHTAGSWNAISHGHRDFGA
jgi:transposase